MFEFENSKWKTLSGRKLVISEEEFRGLLGFKARQYKIVEKEHVFFVSLFISNAVFERALFKNMRWNISSKSRAMQKTAKEAEEEVWNDVGHTYILLELEKGIAEDKKLYVYPSMIEEKILIPALEYRKHFLDEVREMKIISLIQEPTMKGEVIMESGKTVFVSMPFKQQFDVVFDEAIKPTCEKLGLIATRLDREHFSETIVNKMIKTLIESILVVVDLTGLNPNVCYELGFANAFDKNFIILTQSRKLPFDMIWLPYIRYRLEDLDELEKSLEARIKNILAEKLLENIINK